MAGATGKHAGARPPTSRHAGIEILRIAGAFGIVLFHLGGPGAKIGYTALPLFIFLSVYFALTARREISLAVFSFSRMQRLLMPWAFWSVVIAGLKILDALHENRSISSEFAIWNLLAGPAIHLWFLPYVAILSIGLRALLPTLERAGPWMVLPGALAISAAALLSSQRTGLAIPFQQWIFGLPAAIMATSLSLAAKESQIRVALIWGLFSLVMGFGFLLPDAFRLAATLCMFFAARMLPMPLTPGLRALAGLTLGVYILHPVIASALQRIGFDIFGGSMFAVVTTFACTAGLTGLLRTLPKMQRVL